MVILEIWIVAIQTYIIGDTITTHMLVNQQGLREGNPIARYILEKSGYKGMLSVKMGVMSTFILIFQSLNCDMCLLAAGLVFTALGGFATIWNLSMLYKEVRNNG